jgi:polygalacturonase
MGPHQWSGTPTSSTIMLPTTATAGALVMIFFCLVTAMSGHVTVVSMDSTQVPGDAAWTGVFRRAAESLRANGGGILRCKRGRYVTGGFSLFSNTQLHLEDGCEIVASTNASLYECIPSITWDTNTVCDYALITVANAANVTIIGPGVLNGGANSPPGHLVKHYDPSLNYLVPLDIPLPFCTPFNCRIKLVVFYRCRGVFVGDGVHLLNSPFWTLQLGLSDHVVIKDAIIMGDRRWPNGDGIDVVSSTNVHISGCRISTGDDAIDVSSHVEGAPTVNVTVSDNHLSSTSCAQSNGMFVVDDIRNVTWRDNLVTDSNRAMDLIPRIGRGRMSDIVFQNITAQTRFFSPAWWGSAEPITISALPLNSTVSYTGVIENIKFLNIRAHSNNGITLRAQNPTQIRNVSFVNVQLKLEVFGNISRPCKDWRPGPGADSEPIPSMIDGFFLENLLDNAVQFVGATIQFIGLGKWGSCVNASVPVNASSVVCKR